MKSADLTVGAIYALRLHSNLPWPVVPLRAAVITDAREHSYQSLPEAEMPRRRLLEGSVHDIRLSRFNTSRGVPVVKLSMGWVERFDALVTEAEGGIARLDDLAPELSRLTRAAGETLTSAIAGGADTYSDFRRWRVDGSILDIVPSRDIVDLYLPLRRELVLAQRESEAAEKAAQIERDRLADLFDGARRAAALPDAVASFVAGTDNTSVRLPTEDFAALLHELAIVRDMVATRETPGGR